MKKIILLSLLLISITACTKEKSQGNVSETKTIKESTLVLKITESNFEKVVLKNKDKLVIVDFWASWCGPCRKLGPILEKVAKKYPNKVIFTKLNVENNKNIAMKYQIRSIPNVKFFKNGIEIGEFVGLLSEKQIEQKIDKLLKKI